MGTNELNTKVKELRELQQLIEEATAEAETIKDELKAHMIRTGTEEMTVGLFTLRYKTVTGSRFDKNAMIDRFGEECYKSFCKPTESRRFTIG